MKSYIKAIIIVVSIAVIMVGSLTIRNILNKVPDNPIGTVGNTAGNLDNGGLFVEDDERVYFSNSFDNGYLYSMNKDESDIKLITSSPVRNLLLAGDYLYYYMDTSSSKGKGLGNAVRNYGIFRSKKDGKNIKCLDREAAVIMQLIGDYIYYQRYNNTDFTKLYRVKTSNSEPELISDLIINPVAANNGIIYFNGTQKDHFLYAMNIENNQPYTVFNGDMWFPMYKDGYIYYLDVSSNYKLCRFNLSTQVIEILTNDRVDCYNVGDFNIYYQKNDKDEPALIRMNLDGSNKELVADGNYTNINLTSEYAYFMLFGDNSTTYHTPVIGPVNVSMFNEAMYAVSTK